MRNDKFKFWKVNSNLINKRLEALIQMGFKLALDDFGTGYSSLSYLSKFPIDTLKIDKTFVDEVEYDDKQKILLDAIINVAHALHYNIICEGVENETQLKVIHKMGCYTVQGFYFYKPMPSDEFTKLL